jgi:hypothetical protein
VFLVAKRIIDSGRYERRVGKACRGCEYFNLCVKQRELAKR